MHQHYNVLKTRFDEDTFADTVIDLSCGTIVADFVLYKTGIVVSALAHWAAYLSPLRKAPFLWSGGENGDEGDDNTVSTFISAARWTYWTYQSFFNSWRMFIPFYIERELRWNEIIDFIIIIGIYLFSKGGEFVISWGGWSFHDH